MKRNEGFLLKDALLSVLITGIIASSVAAAVHMHAMSFAEIGRSIGDVRSQAEEAFQKCEVCVICEKEQEETEDSY